MKYKGTENYDFSAAVLNFKHFMAALKLVLFDCKLTFDHHKISTSDIYIDVQNSHPFPWYCT